MFLLCSLPNRFRQDLFLDQAEGTGPRIPRERVFKLRIIFENSKVHNQPSSPHSGFVVNEIRFSE